MPSRIVSPRRHASSRLRHALRLLALATLGLAATGAAQAWVSIGESESTSYYLDADTVRSEGTIRRVWRLFDLKEERDGVRSGKALIEIDCRRGTYRYLKTMYYSEPMGTGKYVGGRGQHSREHIAPGTMISQLATRVCEPAADRGAERAAAPGVRPAVAKPAASGAVQPAAKK